MSNLFNVQRQDYVRKALTLLLISREVLYILFRSIFTIYDYQYFEIDANRNILFVSNVKFLLY